MTGVQFNLEWNGLDWVIKYCMSHLLSLQIQNQNIYTSEES